MRDAVSGEIIDAIEAFLRGGGINEMHVAHGSISPPAMAYLVHFPRLSIILDGEDEMEIEKGGDAIQLRMRAGEAVFVPANCWNKPAWTNPVKMLNLLFGKRQTGISMVCLDRPGATPRTVKTHFHRPMEGPVPGILDAIMNLPDHGSKNPTGRLLSEALLHSCLTLLQEPMRHPGSKADKTFQNICMYLQENFQFELTRESVADHFRLSPNHVSRLFRSEGLMRFTDYLTWVRLDRAKYMLRYHDRTLSEVARSCGFSDISYFCRVFKARVRLTPTAYRMQKSAADLADEKSN